MRTVQLTLDPELVAEVVGGDLDEGGAGEGPEAGQVAAELGLDLGIAGVVQQAPPRPLGELDVPGTEVRFLVPQG